MNRSFLSCVAVGSIIFGFAPLSRGDAQTDFVKKYYSTFNTDGTGTTIADLEFKHEVPISEQAEVLARILDKAFAANPPNYQVAELVLVFIGSPSPKFIWNGHLEKAIYAQIKSPNSEVRSCVVDVLAAKRKDSAKDIVLSFQNDPDDQVRADLMDSISKWPEAEPIYHKYIQTHEADVRYALSVKAAKRCIILNRAILKNSGP